MPCEPHRTSAAAEPGPTKMVPSFVIRMRLDDRDSAYARELDAALAQFGFIVKKSRLANDQIGDETAVVNYYANNITFKGNLNDADKHFAALLKYLYNEREKLHIDLERDLLSRYITEFRREIREQRELPNGRMLSGTVYVGAAVEPGHEVTKKIKVLSFRFLLPTYTHLHTQSLEKAHTFIENTLKKYKIKHGEIQDKDGDTFEVDGREDGEAATDVTTFEIHDVEADTNMLLLFAKAVENYSDFQGEDGCLVNEIRRSRHANTVHASAADHKKINHAHDLFHDFIGWVRSGHNLGAIAENKIKGKFNGVTYAAVFGASTKLDLMDLSAKWKVYLNIVADECTYGYQITLPGTGELAVVRLGTKPETFHVHVPASEDEPHELARVIVEECVKHMPTVAESAAAVVAPAIGVLDCYRRLIAALTSRYHSTKFSVAPDIHATIGTWNVRPYGHMHVLHLVSEYTDEPCRVYPDTADGILVDLNGVKHPLPLADCAAPAALLREIVHMYREKARQLATASVEADLAEIEALLVTAAAEPVPTDPNADPDAPKPYVHAIDGKVRGLLQLMTKWTASERNAEGKEDMRKILIELKKLCWPRLSEASRKKLLELK